MPTRKGNQMIAQKFMTVPDVAAHLGINPNSVWLLAKTGALPRPIDHNGAIRWLKTEIEAGTSK